MNTKDFVTYEQAVMLKECGFDWKTEHYYEFEEPTDTEVVFKRTASCNPFNHNTFADSFSAPILDQAAKWLREVKGMDIEIRVWLVDKEREYRPYIMPPKCDDYIAFPPEKQYESALSAGIDAALKLLITNR